MTINRDLIDRDIAFREYYAMGDSRTLKGLHRILSAKYPEVLPSYPTLKDWSKDDDWHGKIIARDREAAVAIREETSKKSSVKRAGLIEGVYTMLENGVPRVEITSPRGIKDMVDALLKLEAIEEAPRNVTGLSVEFRMVEGRAGEKAVAVTAVTAQAEEKKEEEP